VPEGGERGDGVMTMIRSYECSISNWERSTVVHAISRGKAKAEYFYDVKDCCPDLKFTDVLCRAIGAPMQCDGFARTANYRGVPFAKIGMKVECGGHTGYIVGKNSTANFNIYFETGPHKGLTLNCHPNWFIKYFAEDGSVLGDFPGPKEATA
jgi:hypothetical protein